MVFNLKKEEILILSDCGNTMAIGNINNKIGYQKVKISLNLLEKALNYLDKFNEKNITIFVKNENCLMLGKKNIGILIAPIVGED